MSETADSTSDSNDGVLTFESLQKIISEFREQYPSLQRSNYWSVPLYTSPYLPASPSITPVLRYPRLSKAFRRFRLWLERLVDVR